MLRMDKIDFDYYSKPVYYNSSIHLMRRGYYVEQVI